MAVLLMTLDQDLPLIRTRFSPRVRVCISFDGESLTEQYHRDDCDIHTILKRYLKTGVLPINEVVPQYGDFSDVTSFQEAQNIIKRTREYFESLPSRIREQFDNDTGTFLRFVNDPNNESKLVELGIFEDPVLRSSEVSGSPQTSTSVSTEPQQSQVDTPVKKEDKQDS